MSWRPNDEWPDGHIVPNPRDVEASLVVAAKDTGPLMPGPGRRMRKLGRTAAVVVQIALLSFMVLAPSGTFAGKPTADPAASTQTDAKGKAADAKSKKGSTDTQTAPSTDAKGGKGADKTPAKKANDPTTKGKGADKSQKSNKGQEKKAAAAAETTSVAAASGEPTISSDKPDYPPGAKVVLSGTNWQGDESSGVRIVVNDDAGKSWSRGVIVDVAKDGTITDRFRLPDWFAALYTVTATGLDTGRVATTNFTDASIGTYDQCSNDDGDGYGGDPGDCIWINGNLNANNSAYQEGDATVQRLWLTGFEPGSTHSVTFQYGTTKSATHAYDFLTTWDWSEDWILPANRCEDITGCTTASETTFLMQGDPNVPNTIETGLGTSTRQFVMRGGTLTGASAPTLVSGAYGSGDSETSVTVNFTAASSGPMCVTKGQNTTCGVALWFGAHIAKSDDWIPVDTFGGATQIPGSPYHVSLETIDGVSAGQRDNQMQTGAVFVPFNLIIVKNTVGGNDTFDYAVTGDGLNNFSILTSGATGTHEFLNLTPGTADRDVTEDPPPPPDGWTFTSLNCSLTVDGGGGTTFIIGGQTVTVTNSGAGDTLTCTFTNTKLGGLTIVKDTVPNDGTDFAYTTSGAGLSNFSLDDDGETVILSNTKTFSNLTNGVVRTVTETANSAYSLSNIACTGATNSTVVIGASGGFDPGDTSVSVTLADGEAVSCTFTNTKLGGLTIVKDTVPNDGTDFAYTTSGAGLSNFSLDDDGETVILSNTKTFSNLTNGVVRTVTETANSAYSLSNIACTGATNSTVVIGASGGFDPGDTSVSVTLADGEAVSCTFTNTKLGGLTIVKDTVPNDGTDFAYTTSGAGLSNFSLDDDGETVILSNTKTFSNLTNGVVRTVTETANSAYSLSNIACTGATNSTVVIGASGGFDPGDTSVSVTLADGEAVSCTFTNTKLGGLTIVKDTVPNDGTDFAYTTSGAGLSNFSLDDDGETVILSNTKTFSNLTNGVVRTVTETANSAYSLSNIACTGATNSTVVIGASGGFDPGDTSVSVTLADGEAVSCTFTNTKLGGLTIVKDTVPNDGTDFAYTTSGAGLSNFSLDDDGETVILSNTKTFSNLTNGVVRTVTETANSAYSLSNIACTGATNSTVVIGASGGFDPGDTSVSVTLADGEAVSCTFTNTKLGGLTIVKDTVPNDGTDFAYTTSGAGLSNFSLDDDGETVILSNTKTFSNLTNGVVRTVTETANSAYSLSNIACTGATNSTVVIGASGGFDPGDTSVSVTLADGEAVSCTFTNTKLPTIIVKKITTGVAGGPFDFTTTGGNGFDASFTLTTSAPGDAGSDSKSFLITAAGIGGDYTVIEGIEPGFVLTDVSCVITVAGVAGTTASGDSTTRTGTINDLSAGTTVTCTFINSGALTTRTQGFWATHLSLLSLVWNPAPQTVGGILTDGMTDAERTICPAGSPYLVGPLTVAQVEGGFWSSIAKTSTGTNRNAIDKARMRLIQQLLAAILNSQLFGSLPGGAISIQDAKDAYCTGTITEINAAAAAMAAFNESGDSGVFTPGASANPKAAKAIADYIFWDVLP